MGLSGSHSLPKDFERAKTRHQMFWASVVTRADGDLFLGGKQGQTRLRRALRTRLRLRQSLFSGRFWF